MLDLEILPVKEDPSRPKYRECHPNLLKPPFRMAAIGSSAAGKSTWAMNLLRPCFYGGDFRSKVEPVFNKIVVFSPNFGMDSTTRHIKNLVDDNNIHLTYNDGIIDNLIEEQKRLGDNRNKVLIIADDILALGAGPLSKLFVASSYLRHVDCSILYLTQIYQGHYSLPPVVRNNLEGLVFFKNPSQKQIKALVEDLSGTFGSPQNVKNLVDYATLEPFSFCFFDYKQLRVFKKHTEELYRKFNEDGSYAPEFKRPSGLDKALSDKIEENKVIEQ